MRRTNRHLCRALVYRNNTWSRCQNQAYIDGILEEYWTGLCYRHLESVESLTPVIELPRSRPLTARNLLLAAAVAIRTNDRDRWERSGRWCKRMGGVGLQAKRGM